MTKKMLQGIASGIIFTTLIFAYNFYLTDNFVVIKEINSDREITTEEIDQYLQSNQLIAVEKEIFDELMMHMDANLEDVVDDLEEKEEIEISEEITVQEIIFIIEPGTSSSVVASMLEEKQLIKDKNKFEEYLIKAGLETKIKAGEYQLSTDMSLKEIAEKLS